METRIYTKEREILITIISIIVLSGLYAWYVYNRYIVANPELLNDFHFWGKAFILMIPVMIVALIFIFIVFAIINKIITNEDISTMTDEMDHLIELKSLRISRWVYSGCFVLAMGSQAIRMEPWVMFVLLIASGFLGGIAEGIAKIYYYRKGV
jgi:hypothetical protein